MIADPDWEQHFLLTKNNPPSGLLVKAVEHVLYKNKAIDIGAGALNDTRYLLAQGFEVTALDNEEEMKEVAKTIDSQKFHPVVSAFADFEFPKNEYDIVSAMYSLPFSPPEIFNRVFARIKQSLKNGGIFCGQFFGDRDEWASNPEMSFQTKEQAEKLLEGMKVILFDEKEWDGKLADGAPKHKHLFDVIAMIKET